MTKRVRQRCGCLLLAGLGWAATGAHAGPPPNILFIVSEDNGPELGCYGDPYAQTPTLDQLAHDGVRFENAFVTYSVCSPSRSSFYTGRHIAQNGHLGLATHKFAMYETYPTFYRLLQDAGYRTGLIGKLHINPGSAVDPYVDYRAITSANFHEDGRNMTNYAGKASAFIRGAYSGADTNAPFLLTINYPDAHLPMHAQAHGLPEVPLRWNQVRPLPWVGATSQRLRAETANYYNCLRRLDDGIAMLMEELELLGIAENTLVLYMGDHGAQFSRGKTSVYEAGLRIPMIVRWPGHAVPGLEPTELVSILDIMPTFLKAADLPIPAQLTGRPLHPLLEGKDPAWRKYIYGISTGSAPSIGYLQYSVRDARHKLISNPLKDPAMPPNLFALHNRSAQAYLDGDGHFAAGTRPDELAATPAYVQEAYARFLNPPRYELYDLAIDPYEWTNLAERVELADIQQRLIDALDAWQRSEVIQDPMVAMSNQVLYAQAQEDAIGTDYRSNGSFRWSYLEAFPAWRRETYPGMYPTDPPPATGVLYRTGFEAGDGFDFIATGAFQIFTSTVTDVSGAIWIGDGSDSGIWNRSDIPPQGVQALRVGADDGISTTTVTLPAAMTHIGAIAFSYANYSQSTDAEGTLQIRQIGSGTWTDLWTRHFTGLEVDWKVKPWPSVSLPVNLEGPYEIRFRSEGIRGVKFDEFVVTEERAPLQARVDFPTWQSNHFTQAELADSLISGFGANPDQDGLVNGLEYRMGFSPKVWNDWLIEPLALADGFVTATYQEYALADEVVLLQDTDTLSGWEDWHTRVAYAEDVNHIRQVKAIRLPQERDDRVFLRLITPAP